MTVKQQQLLLQYIAEQSADTGYSPGEIDGIQGKKTNAALAYLKAHYGVGADGLIGVIAGTVAPVKTATDNNIGRKPQLFPEAAKYLQADGCYHIPRGVDCQLTEHFRAQEVHCQGKGCCAETVISKRIMDLAEEIRVDIGEPLEIGSAGGSGYRCKRHNSETPGAAANSLHTISDAVDLHYKNPAKLKQVVMRHLKDGEVGQYSWGCHVGRWDRGCISQFTGST